MGLLNAAGKEIAESPVSAESLGELLVMIAKGEISGKMAKDILPKMSLPASPPPPSWSVRACAQISDTGALEKIVTEVIAGNPKQVEQYRAGKTAVLG